MNGQSFRNITLARALTLMKESTHLSLTIKSNLMGFKEMLMKQEEEKALESEGSLYDSGTGVLAMSDTYISGDYTDSSNGIMRSGLNKNTNTIRHNKQFNSSIAQSTSTATTSASSLTSLNNDRRQTLCAVNQPNHLGVDNGHLAVYSATSSNGSNGAIQNNGKTSMFEKLFTLLKGSSIASHEQNDNNGSGYDSTDEVC